MNDFTIDTDQIDADQLLEGAEAIDERLGEREDERELEAQQQAEAEAQPKLQDNEPQLAANDPRRDGVGFNIPDIAAEFGAATGGGLVDTGSSILTAKERVEDMFNGEMAREGENYEPEWNPLKGKNSPVTTTWWGGLLRAGVHYASLTAGLIGAVKLAAVAGIPGAGIAAVATGTKLAKGAKLAAGASKAAKFAHPIQLALQNKSRATQVAAFLGTGATKGAMADVVSEYSQEDNMMGELKKHYPWMEGNPLATNPEDSPFMKTLKNVVEGMGIGIVFDFAGMAMRRGVRKLRGVEETEPDLEGVMKAFDRSDDIDVQKVEMGVMQLEIPGMGAYKNEVIADLHQGSPISRTPGPLDNINERKQLSIEWGADMEGSMSSMTTPAQLARSSDFTKLPTDEIDKIYKESLGDDRAAALMADLQSRVKNPYEVLAESYQGFRELVEGRNVTDATSLEEYFDPVLNGLNAEDLPIKDFGQKIVTMDLVNAANAKNLRDMAIGAREIVDVADVFATDGPMQVIADRLAYGITQVKTARYLWGEAGRQMRTPEGVAKGTEAFKARQAKIKGQKDRMLEMKRDSYEAVTAMMQVAQRSKNEDLTKALLEAFSMSNKVTNLEDLYKFFESKLKGGEFGKTSSSQLIRELQGVMVHSVLSGPKTPVRAIMGTTTATMLRPFAQAIGGAVAMDGSMMREGLASLNAMREVLPEAFQLFRSRLNSYWTGELSTVKTKNFEFSKRDQEWDAIGEMIRIRKEMGKEVSPGTEAAYHIANAARAANNSNLLTYSTKIMAATDDAFGFIMARARARQLAMREALENQKIGNLSDVNPGLLKEAEDKFYKQFLDSEGNVDFNTDAALKFAREEGTLTRDLSGFSKGLDNLMGQTPWAKPFMLFARTGVNGLELTMKHMPLFNRLVKDERRILNATLDQADAGELFDIGIMNAKDLMQSKAIMKGRGAIGAGVITMASMHFMSGNLTGNGPQDRQQRQMMLDAGWRPRSIKIGNVWVSYDSFEPFNSILSFVADIGDHYELMGPEWTEKNLFKTSLVLAQGVANKSYMAGLQQFVDLLSAQPGQAEKIVASLVNNQVPLSSLRNELGKLFNPYMKELNAGFLDNIRNRNQLSEALSGDPLPVKYDLLTGDPIKNWDFPTRMFNMFSPVQMNLDHSPGRALLFNSGYDLRIAGYASPTGVSLKDSPAVRSMYQRAIGEQGLQKKLDKLAESQKVKDSLAQMEADKNAGRFGKDPMDYHHNRVIRQLMNEAQRRAWASIAQDPEVAQLIEKKRLLDSAKANTRRGNYDDANTVYDQAQEVLNMPIR